MADEISLCVDDAENGGADITVCPAEPEDIEICTECAELTLTGTDEPEVGTTYEATGGAGELTFSFDKGTITTTATTCTITGFDGCSGRESLVGTIRVTDECPSGAQTAELKVRLPGGIWFADRQEDMLGGVLVPATYTAGSKIFASSWQPITYPSGGASFEAEMANVCCGNTEGKKGPVQMRLIGSSTWAEAEFISGVELITEVFMTASNAAQLWWHRNETLDNGGRCPSVYSSYGSYADYVDAVESCVIGHDMGLTPHAQINPLPGHTPEEMELSTETTNWGDETIVCVSKIYYRWVCD